MDQEQATHLLSRLERIEGLLTLLIERQQVREWYSPREAAKILGKSEYCIREWCRLGRCHAQKKHSGRGPYPSWVISHDEVLRIQREGLLPINNGTHRNQQPADSKENSAASGHVGKH